MEFADALLNATKAAGGEIIPPAAPVVETPVAAVTDISTPEPKPFDIKSLNEFTKTFGKEFTDENEVKDFFSFPQKYTELENKHKETENNFNLTKAERDKLKKDYEEVGKYVDPKSFFANESLYKSNQMLLKYPDKDAATMLKISGMDVDAAKATDLLVANERLSNPEIYEGRTDQDILDYLASNEYTDIDLSDPDSWDGNTKIKIAKEVKKIRQEFKALQAVELPEKIDVEGRKADLLKTETEKIEQSKIKLSAFAEKVIKDNLELTIPDPDNGTELYKFKPENTEELKAEMADYVSELARNGEDLSNPDTVNKILRRREEIIAYDNLPKILKAHSMRVATEMELKYHDKIHNDTPLSTKVAPHVDVSDLVKSTVQRVQQIM